MLRTAARILEKSIAMAEFPPPQLKEIASEVAKILKDRNESVSIAETVGLQSQHFATSG